MKHKFDIQNIASGLSSRGGFYPGALVPTLDKTGRVRPIASYNIGTTATEPKRYTAKGSPLRNEDFRLGELYFMPVYINGKEIKNATICLTQAKVIVKTQMPGANGSVKEYISLDDMSITVKAQLTADDGDYPEELMEQISSLWQINEAVQIISAITDIMLPLDTKVVLETITIDEVGEMESVQNVTLTLTADQPFELEIK